VPLRVVINDAPRAGLHSATNSQTRPYVLPARRLELRTGLESTKARTLAGELEDEETLRELELRKSSCPTSTSCSTRSTRTRRFAEAGPWVEAPVPRHRAVAPA
jgi:hypothetical protein